MHSARKIIGIVLIMLSFTAPMMAQNTWKVLEEVVYKQEFNEEIGFEMDVPIFGPTLKKYQGKTMEFRGYVLPLEGKKAQSNFMFSLFPFDLCFFCGGAGPETVVEAFTKDKTMIDYSSKPVTIKGVLYLNKTDINRHMYVLRNVELVK